ncbi:MAG TPA: hypothetical protein VHV49_18355 [Pseudonocardiaceae bacterium]|jgi:hypothetical protein|nr:hypothetical protein [Pseudonocardiaceae bacterium]
MSGRIPGDRIRELIAAARSDTKLRLALYYCPDTVVGRFGLEGDAARAVRLGDLSQVDLPEDVLVEGRRLFTELPVGGNVPPAEGAYHLYAGSALSEVCL